MKLAEISANQTLSGIEPDQNVAVMAVVPIGDGSIQLIYRTPSGAIKDRLVTQADAAAFQLACEAKRIDLAFLFDPMMAVHTSNVEPLPHQITAVYESMLPRQPLRYVLADDPGAGKTIMAGLYIRELILRADAHRVLIVAPGSLVEQWRDEVTCTECGLDRPTRTSKVGYRDGDLVEFGEASHRYETDKAERQHFYQAAMGLSSGAWEEAGSRLLHEPGALSRVQATV